MIKKITKKRLNRWCEGKLSEPFISPNTIGKKLPIHIKFKNKSLINRFSMCRLLSKSSLEIGNTNLRCLRKLPWILEVVIR